MKSASGPRFSISIRRFQELEKENARLSEELETCRKELEMSRKWNVPVPHGGRKKTRRKRNRRKRKRGRKSLRRRKRRTRRMR